MFKKFIVSGIIAGGLFDHHFESKSKFVGHGHRNNNGGNSIYELMGDMLVIPPVAVFVLPGMLWMGPGIYLNQKLDLILYPERWNPDYKTPYIKNREREDRERISAHRGYGPGNPKIGDFF